MDHGEGLNYLCPVSPFWQFLNGKPSIPPYFLAELHCGQVVSWWKGGIGQLCPLADRFNEFICSMCVSTACTSYRVTSVLAL